jgi:enoyl-CoA hydratase/carnithine racemase
MSADPVLVAIDRGVAVVTLNRPERQNGWTPQMAAAYLGALEALARDEAVRAIVVTGAGDHFCVGADGTVLGELAETGGEAARAPVRPYYLGLTVAKPVIAAIRGVCFGIGLQQALCCDIRLIGDDAKFSTAYVRRGLSAELGMSWLLPRIVGAGRAADMLLSGRTVRAEEAERMGLANRVVPAADLPGEAIAYARTLAEQCAPRAMRDAKLQLYADLMSDLFTGYQRAQDLLPRAMESADFKEGVKSWQERRPPAFPPLSADAAFLPLRDPEPR